MKSYLKRFFKHIVREELVHFYGEFIMTTVAEVQQQLDTLNAAIVDVGTRISTVDSNLDTIAALVAGLEAGQTTQADLDKIAAAVTTAQTNLTTMSTVVADALSKEDAIK